MPRLTVVAALVVALGYLLLPIESPSMNLETFGEPWDLRKIRAELALRGSSVSVKELTFVAADRSEEESLEELLERGLCAVSGPFVRAIVQIDGRPAELCIHPGLSFRRKNWVAEDGSVKPPRRVYDVYFDALDNVVVVGQGWGPSHVTEVVTSLDR